MGFLGGYMGSKKSNENFNYFNKYVRNRVSVIIPTYNYGRFVLDAVESALAQKIFDLEVIVVDDGSTDNTAHILEPYKGKIRYIQQKNAGLSAARNNGISNSTGEFIQFLDADDILGPHCIASQLDYLSRNPGVFVAVVANKIFSVKDRQGRPKPYDAWTLPRRNLDVHLCYFNIAPPHAFMFRRKAIIDTGWFDSELGACEDYDFWLRATIKGFLPRYNPSGLVYYRRHRESMSANLVNQRFHDAVLHRRLSLLLDQYSSFPEGKRLEALLAFSAGAILTSSRLVGHQLSGARELMQLAQKHIEEAKKQAMLGRSCWNILAKLFYFRIVKFLTFECFKNFGEVKVINENLQQVLTALNAPISKVGLLNDGFKTVLKGSPDYVAERKELAGLLFHFMKRYFYKDKF